MSHGSIVLSQKGHYGMDAFVKSIDNNPVGAQDSYGKGIELGMKAGGF